MSGGEGVSDKEENDDQEESLEDKMRRIIWLEQAGDLHGLADAVDLGNCPPEMIAYAAQKSRDLGNEAFKEKKFVQALEHYDAAVVANVPEKYKIYSNRSACFFQLGKYADALSEAVKAMRENRSWAKGYFRAGRAALEMEYYDEAFELFSRGLSEEPGNADLITWVQKVTVMRDQCRHEKQIRRLDTNYSKFRSIVSEEAKEEEEEKAARDPNRVVLGDKFHNASKAEQRQLKAMLGYKEPPPPRFKPKFNSDIIFRHDARGSKTRRPVWDPVAREWHESAKPAPSRSDYGDSPQAQGLASFLERQSDEHFAEQMIDLLDDPSTAVTSYIAAVRCIADQIANPAAKDQFSEKGLTLKSDSKWLFIGSGTLLPTMAVARCLPKAEISVVIPHRATYVAALAMGLLLANGIERGRVRLISGPQELAGADPPDTNGSDPTSLADCAIFDLELFDPGLLGKGVLPRINHAKQKLLSSDHIIVPSAAAISCVPCEILCPQDADFDWRAGDATRWGAFYETTNLDDEQSQEPWRPLGPVQPVFDFSFAGDEMKLRGQADLRFEAREDGWMNCVAFWYRMSLVEGVALDNAPASLVSSPSSTATPAIGKEFRHALQWLAAPTRVRRGQQVHIRASHSRARVRFELISPKCCAPDRSAACPRWLLLRCREEERTEAFRKAIGKALDKIVIKRREFEKWNLRPLRIAHLGAGLGEVSMVAAKCARDAGVTEEDIQVHGYSVVAMEHMPTVTKLARRVFRDNKLNSDIFISSEDVRKIPDQPQRAQLIICEHFDPGLLGEGLLVLLREARIKMCEALDHEVIPSRAKLWAAAFEYGTHLENYEEFDLGRLNDLRNNVMVDLDWAMQNNRAKQLTSAFEVFEFDFQNDQMPAAHSVTLVPIDTGKITAIVFWYELFLDSEGEVVLTNWPVSVPFANFVTLERDEYRVSPARQAVCHFHGEQRKQASRGSALELLVGYSQAWPRFWWPGMELIQNASGEMIPAPSRGPLHFMYFEKHRYETEELEKRLQSEMGLDPDVMSETYAAAERIALEPNGCPNYFMDPMRALHFHMMFFL